MIKFVVLLEGFIITRRRSVENRDFSLLIAQLFGRTDVRMGGTQLLKVIDSRPAFTFFPYRAFETTRAG